MPSIRATAVLDPNWTVNDVVQRYPSTLRVFNSLGIDSCCGGALPLAKAAEKHRVALDALRSTLENAIRQNESAG